MELDYILSGERIGIPPEWEERLRHYFAAYIWYRDTRDDEGKVRRCWCSECGGAFNARSRENGDIWRSRHRDEVRCPICNTIATMIAEGKMRTYTSLDAKGRAVFADRISRDEVLLRGFYCTMSYDAENVQGQIEMYEDVRYVLTPGEAIMARRSADTGEWVEKAPCEPWPLISNAFVLNRYVFANPDELNGTFLEHAELLTFAECVEPISQAGNSHDQPAYIRYLCAYCRYPVLEWLIKNACYDLVQDFIYLRRKNGKYLDWSAKTIDRFCRLPKREALRWIREDHGSIGIREWLSAGVGYSEAAQLDARFSYHAVVNACREFGGESEAVRAARYLIGQKVHVDLHMLYDYWHACDYLGRDLGNERVRYPKNLREAHDEFTTAEQLIRAERQTTDGARARSEYGERTVALYRELYDYWSGSYWAMVPEQLSDIALEGRNMQHCVGGYTDRHAQGKTIIIFIRDPLYPAIPKYTAEISPDGKLRQVQGYNNRPEYKPDGAANDFIVRWLAVVRERVRKYNEAKLKEKEGEVAV